MPNYPISNVTRRVVYTGSAGVGPYAFSFEIINNTDVAVYQNSTLLTLTTNYSVTINANGTGSITLVVAATNADNITIVGARAVERSTDFSTGGDLFANTINEELDSEVILIQQVAESNDRAIKAPVTDPTTIDMTLPVKTTRAGYVLSFNSTTGNPEVTVSVATVSTAASSAAAAAASASAAASSASSASSSASSATSSAAAAAASAASVNLTTLTSKTSATGASILPAGTTAQRDVSPLAGYIRYNSTLAAFEGYGTGWSSIVGTTDTQTLTNKTLTSPTITSPTVTGSLNAPNTFGFKNRAINGDVRIDQTNAGAAVTVNAASVFYSADMFTAFGTAAAGVFTVQQLAATPPTGFKNYLRYTVTTADATPAASSIYVTNNRIEGLNVIDFSLGTASAIAFTVSFWVRSSLTGAFSGAVNNGAFDRSYPFSFTINSANTWEQKTVTLTGDLTGTWSIANTLGLAMTIDLGTGATARSTASTWQAGAYYGVTGAVRLISTVSSTFDITGVQIETGSVATSWDYRDYQSELARCQRYLPAFIFGATSNDQIGFGQCLTTTLADCTIPFPIQTRIVPTGITISTVGNFSVTNAGGANQVLTSLVFGSVGSTLYTGNIRATATGTPLVAGNVTHLAATVASSKILFTGARL